MAATVNFLVPFTQQVIDDLRGADPDQLAQGGGLYAEMLAKGGAIAWCYLTYSRLTAAGVAGLTLSNTLDRAAINVVHSEHLAVLPDPGGAFIVSAQADHLRRPGAQFHVVQNRNQVKANTVWIHHWPQPGLIGRSSEITRVRKVAYVGQTYNGNLALDVETWRAQCRQQGFEFSAPGSGNWFDMSSYDACIAIRSFDRRGYDNKPASKLINAWLAGLPLIGGYDSAYAQIGRPGEDYLLAETMEQTLNWLIKLDAEPDFRAALVARGRARAVEFDNDAVAALWRAALEGPIAQRFAWWQAHPRSEAIRQTFLTGWDRGLIAAKKAVWATAARFGLRRFGQ